MSESKEYVSQTLDNGAIHISEEVIATIAALAVQDVEGVYGLNTSMVQSNLGQEISKLTKRGQGKGIRLVINENDEISVDCYIVVLYGHSVVDVAKAVQDTITAAIESTTGRTVKSVNVSISGITLPRTAKK